MTRYINDLVEQAKEVRVDPVLLQKMIESEVRVFKQAPRKDIYCRERVKQLTEQYNRVVKDVEKLEKKAAEVKDPKIKARVAGKFKEFDRTAKVLRALLTGMRKDLGRKGSGMGDAAAVIESFTKFKPVTFLLFPVGLAIGVVLLTTLVTGGDAMRKVLVGLGDAAKVGVVILAVGAGVIVSVWLVRVIQDIWKKPAKWEREKEEKEERTERKRWGPGAGIPLRPRS